MILFVKNITVEGPETIKDFFLNRGYGVQTVDLSLGYTLPRAPEAFSAIVCLGGPMNVYEEEKYPYLKDEDLFIKKILKEKIPFLGICLGSQLLAKAAGARVLKSPEKERGFSPVELTQDGLNDPVFKGVKSTNEVFQWHEDMFEVPQQGRLLAASKSCPNQALRVGEVAYGFQFHIEITGKSIRDWTDKYFPKEDPSSEDLKNAMLADYKSKKEKFNNLAKKVYNNFLRIIENRE